MKRVNLIIAGFVAVLMLVTITSALAADPDALYVRYVEGAVSLSEAGSREAMEAVVNTPLIEGDTVTTGSRGRAELFLKDGSMVRAGNNAVLRIAAVDDKGVQLKLEQGSAYIVSRGSRELPIFMGTPLTALDITSPSTVRVDAYSNGISEISVLKGGIFVSQRSGRMLVREGQRLVLKPDGSMPLVAALRASDDWMLWNIQRDAMTMANTGTSESYAYLPDELRTYSSDLDANGQWIYTPEYSYVWVPTVIMAGTWSPYRFGRWAWIRGSYVWVGYEPWGWAPYHYGRWIHHRQAGWCWVPPKHRDVRWEPAHVAWVNSSRHIGWVPLGPGERYDRRSAPVIRQANIPNVAYRNVTIERSAAVAGMTYKNASVANSVVAVERDRMLRQKTTNVTVARPGAAMLKKISLPANVTPARATAGTTGGQLTVRSAPSNIRAASVEPRAAGSKEIAVKGSSPAPAPAPSVKALQMPGNPLSSRIENARASGGPRPQARPAVSERKLNDTRQQAVTPDPGVAKAAPQQRTGAASSPMQPEGLKREAGTRSMTGASPSPVNAVRPVEISKSPVRVVPPQEPNSPVQAGKRPSVNIVNAASPVNNAPSVRAIPSQPAAKAPIPAPPRQANTAAQTPSVNQTARTVVPQRQPSPVVSAALQPVRAPASPRQSQTLSEPARVFAPQAAKQPHAAPPKTAVNQAPQPAPRPAAQTASPVKPAPAAAQPAKNDAKSAQDKNKPQG